ncbi:hypothetical protein ES703_107064 [subsurface metagenome]
MAKIVTLHLEEWNPSVLRKIWDSISPNYLFDGAIVKLYGKNYRIIRKQVREI